MKKAILGFVVAGVLTAAPFAASAQSVDLQAQINVLLEQIKVLQMKLNELLKQQPAVSIQPTPPVSSNMRICALLNRNLSQGSTGNDVSGLQEFLNNQGYLSANATGFFGPMTAQAVAKWQVSQGVDGVGTVGPMTRERIKTWCLSGQGGGAPIPPADWKLRADPQKGAAPLTVTFGANVTLTNNMMVADAGDYKIVFGDGSEYVFSCTSTTGMCNGPQKTQHTYTSNGTYTAKLIHYGYFGIANPDGSAPTQNLGEVTIYVGDQGPIACTMEYNPVCGAKPIVCITTPCNPVPTTYGNKCAMNADGASFLYAGECKTPVENFTPPANCKAWNDGCNTCSRSTPTSPAMCTMRACLTTTSSDVGSATQSIWAGKGFCSAYFDDTGNKPPVVSSFSGPTTLSLNQTGTWSVQASDPENQQLTYKISWGDVTANMSGLAAFSPAVDAFVQTTTFTHAYAVAGVYTVRMVVHDSAGGEAVTTSTVKVGNEGVVCTMEYAPVCGQPPEPACRYSMPACMVATPGPKTYSNRCMMNAAGATFISEGMCVGTTVTVCSADARMCPNGTYVGRTGPNCEFVCPSTNVY